MARKVYRVLPDGGDWKVTLDSVFQKTFSLKSSAVDWAVAEAKANKPSQVVVHRADGTIEEEWTYGDDPFPPPG
jgi:hypothetical protein